MSIREGEGLSPGEGRDAMSEREYQAVCHQGHRLYLRLRGGADPRKAACHHILRPDEVAEWSRAAGTECRAGIRDAIELGPPV